MKKTKSRAKSKIKNVRPPLWLYGVLVFAVFMVAAKMVAVEYTPVAGVTSGQIRGLGVSNPGDPLYIPTRGELIEELNRLKKEYYALESQVMLPGTPDARLLAKLQQLEGSKFRRFPDRGDWGIYPTDGAEFLTSIPSHHSATMAVTTVSACEQNETNASQYFCQWTLKNYITDATSGQPLLLDLDLSGIDQEQNGCTKNELIPIAWTKNDQKIIYQQVPLNDTWGCYAGLGKYFSVVPTTTRQVPQMIGGSNARFMDGYSKVVSIEPIPGTVIAYKLVYRNVETGASSVLAQGKNLSYQFMNPEQENPSSLDYFVNAYSPIPNCIEDYGTSCTKVATKTAHVSLPE